MSEIKKQITTLLKITCKVLESLTEEQCENILSGKAKFKYEEIVKDLSIEKKVGLTIKTYVTRIEQFNSREEIYSYIHGLNLKKVDLIEIAKQLKVHLNKSDKKDIMVKKIVEGTIGAKLRTDAIKNIKLKESE